MPELECKLLMSEEEVEALAPEWRELHLQYGRNPFSDYDWFQIWWSTIEKTRGSQLFIVVGRKDNRLVAVLPLVIVRRGGFRIMHAAGYKAFYYCDMICENPAHAAEIWRAAVNSHHYDFADIRDVYQESVCYQALSLFARKRDEIEAFRLRFQWPTSEAWADSISTSTKKTLRRYVKRLHEKGVVQYEVFRNGPLPLDIIDAMVKRKVAWTIKNKQAGVFNHPDVLTFFHKLLEIAARQDRLLLGWLKCGDDIIAYDLLFIYRGVLHGFVVTHDPDWSAFAPGIQVMVHSISWGIDHGLQAMDHRQGSGGYKGRYSNEISSCAEFTFSRSLHGRLAEGFVMGARTLWRFLTRRSPAKILDKAETQKSQ